MQEELRRKLGAVPGLKSHIQLVQNIQIGSRVSSAQYQYTLQGIDQAELFAFAPKLQERIRQLPGLPDVSSDLQLGSRQASIDIDRDAAARLGVTVEQVRSPFTAPSVGARFRPSSPLPTTTA